MKASRPIGLSRQPPAGFIPAANAVCSSWACCTETFGGWMCTGGRNVPRRGGRTVARGPSARTMQIYGVTVNTAAERIIHSGAYLAERVHAFTLGHGRGRRPLSYPVRERGPGVPKPCGVRTCMRAYVTHSEPLGVNGAGARISVNIKRLIYYLQVELVSRPRRASTPPATACWICETLAAVPALTLITVVRDRSLDMCYSDSRRYYRLGDITACYKYDFLLSSHFSHNYDCI